MARWNLHILIIIFCVLLYMEVSCNINRPCDKPTKFPVETTFYTSNSEELQDTILENITLYGIGREDSLLYNGIDTNKLNFRLSPFSDTTSIVIISDSNSDTLVFFYKRHLQMVSPECDFAMFFDIVQTLNTTNFIDSISLLDKTLDADKKEHLQVFVH